MAGSCRVTRNGRPSLRADRWAGNSCRPLIQNHTFRFLDRDVDQSLVGDR